MRAFLLSMLTIALLTAAPAYAGGTGSSKSKADAKSKTDSQSISVVLDGQTFNVKTLSDADNGDWFIVSSPQTGSVQGAANSLEYALQEFVTLARLEGYNLDSSRLDRQVSISAKVRATSTSTFQNIPALTVELDNIFGERFLVLPYKGDPKLPAGTSVSITAIPSDTASEFLVISLTVLDEESEYE